MTVKDRLAAWRKRRRAADTAVARLDGKIRTRLIRLAQRPALAAYLARTFNLRFTSGWRSVQHNKDVGGVPGSWHTKGTVLNPAASDMVGTETDMQSALEWARKNVPDLAESMLHDVGSGRHLHLGGWGVARWRLPNRGLLKKWRERRQAQQATRKRADEMIAKLKRRERAAARAERQQNIAREHGAQFAGIIWDACQKYQIPYALGLAMVEQESGFLNQYGHDRDRQGRIIWHGKTGRVMVTAENIQDYLEFARRTGQRQGVGPLQLTSGSYQDAAVRRGGLHRPEVTIPYGLSILKGHMDALGEFNGIGAYNGGRGNPVAAYARNVQALQAKWRERLR